VLCKLSVAEHLEDPAQRKESRVMANHPPLRDGSDKVSKESKEAVKWVEAGFREYADIIWRRGQGWAASDTAKFEYSPLLYRTIGRPYRGGIHNSVCVQVERYGEEFGRLLREEVEMSEQDDPLAARLALSLLYA
jgi:hypothetical protein